MKKNIIVLIAIGLLYVLIVTPAESGERTSPLIIDHGCTILPVVPFDWVDAVQANCKWYYERLSHGQQLNEGLDRIELSDPTYDVATDKSGNSLPVVPGALCIYTSRPDAWDFWHGTAGMSEVQGVLNGNPALNVFAYCWCDHLDSYSASYVDEYLAAMNTLEEQYPGVVFVYYTGTAEHYGAEGYNRYLRNEQIRQYCSANNKVLFDFADLDCWWLNPSTQQWEHSTYQYNGYTVPVEHPELAGSDIYHTSYESCEQKAKAVWWMMAMLEGWEGSLDVTMTSFSGECIKEAVVLKWSANATEPFDGFIVYRSDDGGEHFRRINLELVPAGENNRFVDRYVKSGRTYIYRIGALQGGIEYSSLLLTVTVEAVPFKLNQNYPNPFNPSTTISFNVDEPQLLALAVYDAGGRMVKKLFEGEKETGVYTVEWNGTNGREIPVSSGVYYYRLRAGKNFETRKMILMR